MNVALIGSGSWGTAVAGLAAARAERVTMWAHSEQTAAGINGEHRNPRYLVGYELPGNVVATTDLAQALDCGVAYDNATRAVVLDPAAKYDAE